MVVRFLLGLVIILGSGTVYVNNYDRFFEATVQPAFIIMTAMWYTKSEQTVLTSIWYCMTGVQLMVRHCHALNTSFINPQILLYNPKALLTILTISNLGRRSDRVRMFTVSSYF